MHLVLFVYLYIKIQKILAQSLRKQFMNKCKHIKNHAGKNCILAIRSVILARDIVYFSLQK